MTAGGLWNTMILVFKVCTVLEMMHRLCPVTLSHFLDIFDAMGTPREAESVELRYEKLEPLNFSKDFLEKVGQTTPTAIAVLPVLGVYWSDWGSPERLVQILNDWNRQASNSAAANPPSGKTPPVNRTIPSGKRNRCKRKTARTP